jgi:hypothetical protein
MLRALAVCCAFVLAAPRAAAAEWNLTPMFGYTFHGNTSIVDLEDATDKAHRQIGGAATLLGKGPVGVEAITVYTPAFFRRDDLKLVEHGRSFALMGNAVLTVPRRWTEYSLRPFVSGGLGLLRVSVLDTKGVLPVRSNLAGFNIGGGAVGFLSPRTGVRFDLRYHSTLNRSDNGPVVGFGPVHLSYLTASVGLVLRR